MKVVEGLMHNIATDGMSMSEINRLLYTGSYGEARWPNG